MARDPVDDLGGLARRQVRDVDVAGARVPPGRAGGTWPAGDLEALEAVGDRPVGDLHQRRLGERRGQQAESHRRASAPRRRLTDDLDPAPEPGALGDRVVDQHLVVAVGEGRVTRVVARAAGRDVRVDRPEVGRERVAEALDVATRERGGGAAGGPIRAGFLIRISFGRSRWPNQIWSGCSESQATDESDPSISYWSEFFRPGADLADADRAACPVLEAEQDRRGILGRDHAGDGVGRDLGREGLDRTGRLASGADEGGQVGHDLDDALTGHEGHQVEPVRADVADRAERAAAVGLEPPVPVALEQEPVLEVATGDQPDIADLADVTTSWACWLSG